MSLIDVLDRQFSAAWQMLSDGAMKCPEDEWKQPSSDPFFTPARLVFHVIQTVDFYTADDRDGFDWNAFGFSWEDAKPEELPDRPAVREYCHCIREQMEEWLGAHGSEGLLEPDTEFFPQFKTRLDRAIYALRHTQHHAGQLSRELQSRGCEEMSWG